MGEVGRHAQHAGARSAQRVPQALWYVHVVAFLELYGDVHSRSQRASEASYDRFRREAPHGDAPALGIRTCAEMSTAHDRGRRGSVDRKPVHVSVMRVRCSRRLVKDCVVARVAHDASVMHSVGTFGRL